MPKISGEGAVLGGVLETFTGLNTELDEGQAVLAVRHGSGLTSLGISVSSQQVTTKVLSTHLNTVTVMEFFSRELCHENECAGSSKTGANMSPGNL